MSANQASVFVPETTVPLGVAIEQALAACDGDPLTTIGALIIECRLLGAELSSVYAATSKGYMRGKLKRGEEV